MTKDALDRFEAEHGANLPDKVFDRARGEVAHLLRMEAMTRSLRGPGDAVRLLDFGCGWGRLVTLASLFGFDAVGIDRSNARRGAQRGGLGTIYPSLEDFAATNPPPLHAVSLQQVLEHLTAPAPVLRALHRLMAPSAILLLEVPDAGGVTKIETAADLVLDGLDHVNAFSARTLLGIAERAGFRAVVPPIAHVTADLKRVAKREASRLVRHLVPRTTQQFFRRV
jgi:SAM-dependent methyltransferase